MKEHRLEQDGRDNLIVVLDEDSLLSASKRFFKWRKVTTKRIYNLGSKNWNDFIAYLHPFYGVERAPRVNTGTQRSPFGMWS